MIQFELEAKDHNSRAGILKTLHGTIHTPVFMPVGTLGTVKALTPEEVSELGAEIILETPTICIFVPVMNWYASWEVCIIL